MRFMPNVDDRPIEVRVLETLSETLSGSVRIKTGSDFQRDRRKVFGVHPSEERRLSDELQRRVAQGVVKQNLLTDDIRTCCVEYVEYKLIA